MTKANLQTVINSEPNSCLGAQILLEASEAMVCKKRPTGEACGQLLGQTSEVWHI